MKRRNHCAFASLMSDSATPLPGSHLSPQAFRAADWALGGPRPARRDRAELAGESPLWAKIRRYFIRAHGRMPNQADLRMIETRIQAFATRPPPELPPPPMEQSELPAAGSVDFDWMSDRERADAAAAVRLARELKIGSVKAAVLWWSKRRDVPGDVELVAAVHDFMLCKHSEGISEAVLRHYYQQLKRLAREFPDRSLNSIGPDEMAGYLMRWPNASSRRSIWQALNTFFQWATRIGLIIENPVMRGMRKPRPAIPVRHVLSVEETKALLRQAIENRTIVFWALSLFAGLRTQEVLRLGKMPDPWRLVGLEVGVIDLREQSSKVWPRTVPILPVLAAWIDWSRTRNYPIVPGDFIVRFRNDRRIVLAQHYPPEFFAPKPRWVAASSIANIGRRTYISCRLALPGASFATVANEVGNSEYNIRLHYFQKVSQEQAEAFFGLTPDKV